jgi:hypothetical protein
LKTEIPYECEQFRGGTRLWWPFQAEVLERSQLLQLDWSLSRPARDRGGRLVRLIDLPDWVAGAGPGRVADVAIAESPPVLPQDVSPNAAWDGVHIEVGEEVFVGVGKNDAARWEYSPRLGRYRGLLTLLRTIQPFPNAFEEYLLRLNASLRFARVGHHDDGIALCVVAISGDCRWSTLAQNALAGIAAILRRQVAWWAEPSEVLADLLANARL